VGAAIISDHTSLTATTTTTTTVASPAVCEWVAVDIDDTTIVQVLQRHRQWQWEKRLLQRRWREGGGGVVLLLLVVEVLLLASDGGG
jgi:hypothetical protein